MTNDFEGCKSAIQYGDSVLVEKDGHLLNQIYIYIWLLINISWLFLGPIGLPSITSMNIASFHTFPSFPILTGPHAMGAVASKRSPEATWC